MFLSVTYFAILSVVWLSSPRCARTEDQFLKFCNEYKLKYQQYKQHTGSVSCERLKSAHAAKEYAKLAQATSFPLPVNKSVFTNAYFRPGQIGDGFVQREDTWAGYILYNVRPSCGKETGLADKDQCWPVVVDYFASYSRGVVNYVIEGETLNIHGYFTGYGISSLPSGVTEVRIYIRPSANHPKNNCASTKLRPLLETLRQVKKPFSCVDSKEKVLGFFCGKEQNNDFCYWLYGRSRAATHPISMIPVVCATLFASYIKK